MPLTPEQIAAAQALADADAREVADALKEHANGAYQAVYARGYGTHTKDAKPEVDRLNAEVARLTEEAAEAHARVKRAEKDRPDVAALENEKRQALAAKDAEHKAALDAIRAERAAEKLDTFAAGITARAAGKLSEEGLDWYQNKVLALRNQGRLKAEVGEGEPALRALQPDGTPYAASSDDELSGLVADAVLKDAPAWALRSGADGGAGTSGSNGRGGAGAFDAIKADVKKQYGGTSPEEARKRLGITTN